MKEKMFKIIVLLGVCWLFLMIGCTEAKHKPETLTDARYEFLEVFENGSVMYITLKDKQTGHEYLLVKTRRGASIVCLTDKAPVKEELE